ncbi:MAG: Iron hydrogenase 1 [Syntrophomonadaceae bacterium]|nr:Iron hydrogenase 1 [Bacillota bacterium]
MLTTSCCPSWVYYAKKINQKFKSTLSHTPSPMLKAEDAKKSGEIFVFIGPCISKKKEAENTKIDYVLTFEELACMFAAKNIDVVSCKEKELDIEGSYDGRVFAKSGGVIEAVKHNLTDAIKEKIQTEQINGLNKESIEFLNRTNNSDFTEIMICEWGCIGGPCVVTNPAVTQRMLDKFLSESKP